MTCQRLAWLSADIVLETRHVQAVRRMWAVLRSEALFSSNMAAKTLSISGSPTLGKTTLATWIARDHERRERARYPTLGTDEFQPSVYVVTPPATTPKMLMIAFSNFLGIPHARAITAQDLSHRVVLVLKSLRTSLVVLDEVHNVQSNRQLGAEAASTLKLFAERLDCAFIFAGIDLDRSPVFAGAVGEQLASRSLRYDLSPCGYQSAGASEEWTQLVASCLALLPLSHPTDEFVWTESGWLYEITGGSIGRLRGLLRRAAIDAIISGREKLTRNDLEAFAYNGAYPRVSTPRQRAHRPPGKASA